MEAALLGTAVGAEYAAYADSCGPLERASHARRLFEICCAYEQVNSDLYAEIPGQLRQWCHHWARKFAELASQLAGQLLLGEPGIGLDEVVGRCREHVLRYTGDPLAVAFDLLERSVPLPECFMRDLLDLDTYARFVREWLVNLTPAAMLVVGIRTSGSYLAPVWDAVLAADGVTRVTLTTRPKRSARLGCDGRFADASPTDCWLPPDGDAELMAAFLAANDPRTVSAAVVDDVAFTGSQFVRVDNYLCSLGIEAANIHFIQNAPLVMTSLTATAFERLSARRVWSAPRTPDGPRRPDVARQFFSDLLSGGHRGQGNIRVDGARLAPATFAQRHLAGCTTVPVDQFVHFNPRGRDRHYLIEARSDGLHVKLFGKVLGTGFFAEQEVHRIRRYAEVGYRVVTCRGGFLFYEWIAGEPLGPGDGRTLTADDLDQLAAYAAMLSRHNKGGHVAPDGYAADVISRLRAAVELTTARAALAELAASVFVTGRQEPLPMVDAPRNQGHWHHVRAGDGRLRRVHLDLGEWSWRMDVAEELAAAVIELDLSPAQTARLVSGYQDRTGDVDVARRMTLATMAYVARTLDMYRFWDGQLQQIPEKYRRSPDDPELARTRTRPMRLLRGLDRALTQSPGSS